MGEEAVASQQSEEKKAMIRMTPGQYAEFMLKEHVRESARKRGIEIIDEDGAERAGPRLVASHSEATVLPLVRAERGEAE
jgi:hypothetical protein